MSTPCSSSAGNLLLVVDDDPTSRRIVSDSLRHMGYEVEEAGDGVEGLEVFARRTPDLVLLDVGMPRMDGWGVLETLRDRGYRNGVIMLTGADMTDSLVRALDGGADDFIGKPLVLRELFARVSAVLRRSRGSADHGVLRIGSVRVDLHARVALRDGRPLALTQIEFKLLEQLEASRGRAVLREELLRKVWGYSSAAATRTVDTHVWRLRRKICEDTRHPRWIRTVPGGYRLADAGVETAPV